MNLDHIDKIFANQQEQFNKMPSDDLWAKLDQQLQQEEAPVAPPIAKVRPLWQRYAAAAVAAIVFVSVLFTLINHSPETAKMAENTTETASPAPSMKKEKMDASADMEPMESEEAAELVEEAIAESKKERVLKDEAKREVELTDKDSPVSSKQRSDSKITAPYKNKNTGNDRAASQQINKDANTGTTAPIGSSNVTTMPAVPAPKRTYSPPPPPSPAADVATKEAQEQKAAAFKIEDTEQPLAQNSAYARYNLQNTIPQFNNQAGGQGMSLDEVTAQKKQAKSKLKTTARDKGQTPEQKQEGLIVEEIVEEMEVDDWAANTINQFGWMMGKWCNNDVEVNLCENWTLTDANTLQGNSLTMYNGKIEFTENMTITQIGDEVYYNLYIPEKDAVVPFKLLEQTGNQTIFINDQNDYPNMITYIQQANGILTTRFEGQQNGKAIEAEIDLIRTD